MLVREIVNMKSGDLFRLLLIGYAGVSIPLGVLAAILALTRTAPANFNGESYYGIQGFAISLVTVPFYALIMSSITWLFLILGLRFARMSLKLLGKY